ncbi:MAG: putative lipid II flippase FtsW [Oscillospiraceae bacterium]|nr:putative lipid II flippase FtsW [Oscillospiraceae bacterium]
MPAESALKGAKGGGERRVKSALREKPKSDSVLLLVTIILVVFGLITMFSASFANAYYLHGDSYYYIGKQCLYAIIGLAAMWVISHINYRVLHRLALPLAIVSYILLAITLFMPPINGARRWIIIGGFTFQPSEVVKFAVICLFAHLASVKPEKMKGFKYGFLLPMGILLAIAAIMLQQTHLSGTILIFLVGVVLMFVGGTRPMWFGIAAAIVVPAGGAFLLLTDKMSYALERIEIWLNPYIDPLGGGHQIIQSLRAIGSGGLIGLGLGNSRQKHLYVPEPQNDFIFSIICEELGYVGALFVIVLFLIFIFRGFAIALNARDKFGALLAVGITSQIGLQALLNIAVVTGTVPNTGISLPFFSQGGTSLAMLLAEVGVLLAISRYSAMKKS